jgi:hypothetical protein
MKALLIIIKLRMGAALECLTANKFELTCEYKNSKSLTIFDAKDIRINNENAMMKRISQAE